MRFDNLARESIMSAMRMCFLALAGLILIALPGCHKENPVVERWTRTLGGTASDAGNAVVQTADGGYFAVGTTYSFGADSGEVYLVKTNAQGDTLWTRMYGGDGYYEGLSGEQTADGGYVATGYVWREGYQYMLLIKTDASGDTLWMRTFEFAGYECGFSVQQTTDGGYIIVGYSVQDSFAVYLVRTNREGYEIWSNVFGGTDFEEGVAVRQTTDHGYIVAGDTKSFGAGGIDVYLFKTNQQGDTQWSRTYGGTNEDRSSSVQPTSDGGYVVAGYTRSFGAGGADVFLIKTNPQGDTQWTRTYGGANDDVGSSVRQTADGGYIIAGTTSSFGAGGSDVYVVRVDSSGKVEWTRTFGGDHDDCGYGIAPADDGGYIICGSTSSYGAGDADVWLLKTDSRGNAEPDTL
jgi:hypothetical protein